MWQFCPGVGVQRRKEEVASVLFEIENGVPSCSWNLLRMRCHLKPRHSRNKETNAQDRVAGFATSATQKPISCSNK